MTGLFKYWGRSPMPIRPPFVENNYYMSQPSYHCCNGGGSRLWNIMAMLGFMNNMQTQYYPQQSFYPYMNLSSQQQYIPETDPFATCRSLYPEFRYSKNGDTYYCRATDGKLYSAASEKELLEQIGKISSTDGGGATTSDIVTNRNNNTSEIVVNQNEGVSDTPTHHQPASAQQKAPEGWIKPNSKWIEQQFTSKNISQPTAQQIIEKYTSNNIDITKLTDEKKSELLSDIIDNNKSCFNSDGSCNTETFNFNNLYLPGDKTLKEKYGVPEKVKNKPMDCVLEPGSKYKYAFYDENGAKIDKLAYAEKYPEEYLEKVKNLKDKYWTPETFKKAMELYNEKFIEEHKNDNNEKREYKGFKCFKIKYDKDTGKPEVWCDYHGYRGTAIANYTVGFEKGYRIAELETAFNNINSAKDNIK